MSRFRKIGPAALLVMCSLAIVWILFQLGGIQSAADLAHRQAMNEQLMSAGFGGLAEHTSDPKVHLELKGCVTGLETFANAVHRLLSQDRLWVVRREPERIRDVASAALGAEWRTEERGRVPTLPQRLGTIDYQAPGDETRFEISELGIEYRRNGGSWERRRLGGAEWRRWSGPLFKLIDPEHSECEGKGYAFITIPPPLPR